MVSEHVRPQFIDVDLILLQPSSGNSHVSCKKLDTFLYLLCIVYVVLVYRDIREYYTLYITTSLES